MKQLVSTLVCLSAACLCTLAWADTRPDTHAPIGVMGDHTHQRGEVMFSYRYMHMSMQDNVDGSSDLSSNEIATTVPNIFFGQPGQPPTLRVVPTEMTMDMHMFGMMWAPSDRVTLMGMVNYITKEMDHVTFQGGMGTNRLGKFTTKTSGLGDISLSALIKLDHNHQGGWHGTLGVSLPTGDIDETDRILTPMNMRPTVTLPYPMQLGSGTYDLITGLTYNWYEGKWSAGGQWRSVFRLGENDEDYSLGDEHKVNVWMGYLLAENLSGSVRLEHLDRGAVDGMDPRVVAPVQTANPDFLEGSSSSLSAGLNFVLPNESSRIAFEFSKVVDQDLEGPQLSTDWVLTVGFQHSL